MSAPGGWGAATRSGLAWSTGAYVLTKASTLLTTLVMARLLAPSEFGVVAAVLVFLTFIELGSSIGMKATVVFEQEQGITRRVQTAFTTNVLLSIVLTILALLLAPAIADVFRMGEHADLFRLGALNIFIIGLGNVQDSLLLRELEFRRRIIPEATRAAVRGGVSIALALWGLEGSALVWGMLAGSAAWTVVQWWMTRFRPTFTLDVRIVRSMLSYGSGAAFLELVAIVTSRADTIIVGRVLGDAALGLYTVAFRIPETLIDAVAWNLSSVAFPALSRKREREGGGFAASALRIVHFQSLFALPLAVGLAILAPPLVVVLFGEEWKEAGGVMSAVAIMSGVHAVVFPLGDGFKALGRQRLLSVLLMIQLPLLIGGIVLAAPAGILAVAWVRAAGTFLHTGMMIACAGPVFGVRFRQVLSAAYPAFAATAGVAVGTGAARILFPQLNVVPLLVGIPAGLACALLFLRVAAPSTMGDLLEQFKLLRGGGAPPAEAPPKQPVMAGRS